MNNITAITFDLWDTLYIDDDYKDLCRKKNRFDIIHNSLKKNNFDICDNTLHQAIIHANKIAKKTWYNLQKTCGAKERFNIILKYLKIDLEEYTKCEIANLLEESGYYFPPLKISGIENILENLSKKYKLGLISDTGQTSGRVLRKILQRDNIYDYFLEYSFSDEIGVSKPHKKIFDITLKKLCSLPSNTVHIGDNIETDICGAINYGMKVIHITNENNNAYINNKNYYQVDNINNIYKYL